MDKQKPLVRRTRKTRLQPVHRGSGKRGIEGGDKGFALQLGLNALCVSIAAVLNFSIWRLNWGLEGNKSI